MLKAGIFVDVDNIMRNGGFGLRYKRVRELVEAQGVPATPIAARRQVGSPAVGATVVRAVAYGSIDPLREEADGITHTRREQARQAIRRAGFKLVLKPVKRYPLPPGAGAVHRAMLNDGTEESVKANIDVDLTVDVLMQADELDYVLLVTGDGDFVKLVEALQTKGKKVDLLAFMNVSRELKEAVDFYFNGFLLPGMLPTIKEDPKLRTGYIHYVDEEKPFGFLTMFTGFGPTDVNDNIYINPGAFGDTRVSLQQFRQRGAIIAFDVDDTQPGRLQARNASQLVYDNEPVFM